MKGNDFRWIWSGGSVNIAKSMDCRCTFFVDSAISTPPQPCCMSFYGNWDFYRIIQNFYRISKTLGGGAFENFTPVPTVRYNILYYAIQKYYFSSGFQLRYTRYINMSFKIAFMKLIVKYGCN